MSKYIIELKDDVQVVQKVVVTENGNAFVMNFYKDQLEELTADYINEHFGSLQDDAYKRGLEDGKQTAVGAAELREKLEYQKGFKDGKADNDKGCEGCECETHKDVTCTMCSNNYMNLWTAKDDKIVVGDEVADKNGDKTIVTYIYSNLFDGLCSDGSTMTNLFLDDNHKTGRHFDIDKILDEMKGTGTDDDTY